MEKQKQKEVKKFTPPDLCFDGGITQCEFYNGNLIQCTKFHVALEAGANYWIRLPCAACMASRKSKGGIL